MTEESSLEGFMRMSGFDPTKPAELHDELNDEIFEWKPEWKTGWDKYATYLKDGIVEWDGLLIDGWRELKKETA